MRFIQGSRFFILGLFIVFLAGCGQKNAKQAAQDSGKLFGASFQTLNNPFFVEVNEGLKRVVEEHGDKLVTLDAQWNSLKQKNDIADLLQQAPEAIFINPVNWEGIKGTLIEAKRRNVPVIIVDAPVSDTNLVLCQVASDNFEAGRLACEALAKTMPASRIVVLHVSVNKACIDRFAGFRKEMEKHPGMKILDIQEGGGTTEVSRPVMRDLLGRFPEVNGVFALNDPSAFGCISAIESMGKLGQVTVVTVDGSREGVNAIKSGKLFSTSAQFPGEIGRIAAEKAYEHLDGKPVQKDIKVPVKLITRDNADDFLKGL